MTLSIRIDAKGAGDALAKSALILRHVDQALNTGAVMIRDAAVLAAPKADGDLHRGIQAGRLSQLLWQVNSRSTHGRYVELGTKRQLRPDSRPPAGNRQNPRPKTYRPSRMEANILLWMQRRNIQPRQPIGRGGIEQARRSAAYLIARHIARTGTRAQPYMAPQTTEATALKITALVERAIQRGLADAGLA